MFSTPLGRQNNSTTNSISTLPLKLTSPPYIPRPRSPTRLQQSRGGELILKNVLGNTVTSPNCFDARGSVIAYTAGAVVVVRHIASNGVSTSQRILRARPYASPFIASATLSSPSTPTGASVDHKYRVFVNNEKVPNQQSPLYSFSTFDSTDTSTSSAPSKISANRERLKSITCLSLSCDGKYLAAGEVGYNPRVLIFGLESHQSTGPLEMISDHSFGIRAVAFSPNLKFLASLGYVNDGFLYVWAFDQRSGVCRPHSSNKCTSYVRAMAWVGSNLVTVGTRHIKVWRVEISPVSPSKQRSAQEVSSPSQTPHAGSVVKTLGGRNCLLGPLAEATFTSLVAVSETQAVICSDRGDICLLDVCEGRPKMSKVAEVPHSILCVATDSRDIVRVGGRNNTTSTYSIKSLIAAGDFAPSGAARGSAPSFGSSNNSCAIAFAAGRWFQVTSQRSIQVDELDSNESKASDVQTDNTVAEETSTMNISCHDGPVLGIEILDSSNDYAATFLTYSSSGLVIFWDSVGNVKYRLQLEREFMNNEDNTSQLLVLRASRNAKTLYTGDNQGVMKVLDLTLNNYTCAMAAKSHAADIIGLASLEMADKKTLLASCGRDRTVQLYFDRALQQTIECPASIVSFSEDGEKLCCSCSDRTVHIRQLVRREMDGVTVLAAVPFRIITLKTSPVSMILNTQDGGNCTIIVSLNDRTIAHYDTASGRLISSHRDSEGSDAIKIKGVKYIQEENGNSFILAGITSIDVRAYDGVSGTLLYRGWGHTASITDADLIRGTSSDSNIMVTTASDGIIMLWDLCSKSSGDDVTDNIVDRDTETPLKEIAASRPPLRRVLSRAEISDFERLSPAATPSGRNSPPRSIRRKTSKLNVSSQSPKQATPTPVASTKYGRNNTDSHTERMRSPRNRSRSPSSSSRPGTHRRPSLPSLESTGRNKSTGNFSEFGTLNMATEQVCRTLRAYRRKITTSEPINDDLLKELDQELRITAKAIGERLSKTKALNETVLTTLLDQYSERLVSMFDEKLKISLNSMGPPGSEIVETSPERQSPATDVTTLVS